MTDLFLAPQHEWPEVTLDSLRKPFPFPRNRKGELGGLQRALNRLVQGERDGKAMAPEEAVAFLRSRIEQAAQELAGRERTFVPHLTTWLNQARYLRSHVALEPEAETLSDAMRILKAYPWRTPIPRNREHLTPVLKAIERGLASEQLFHGRDTAAWILCRTETFAAIVATWPLEDLQYLPGPLRFFQEERWKQDERLWYRGPRQPWQSERNQMARTN